MKIRLSIAAAGVAVAGLLVTGLAPAASATDRGANGSIAFSHAGSQIAVLGAGGTETILTPSGGNQTWPAFSPDGTRIAFVQTGHLWIMKANGSDTHAVSVTGNPYEGSPAWSPNATKLAYINGTDGQIYTVPASGGTPTHITSGITEMADIRWSPDGTKIVFDAKDTAATGYRQIFRVNLTTKTVTRLTSGACDSVEPDWSPDGTQIVFAANEGLGSQQLWESSPANSGDDKHVTATRLTNDPGQPLNTAPSWQPVHHPHLALNAGSGAPGATVTVTGSDFLSGQTVKLTFVDAHGTTTALGSAKTPLNGGFTINVTIPAGAAAGAGKIKATGVGGLSATKTFTVS